MSFCLWASVPFAGAAPAAADSQLITADQQELLVRSLNHCVALWSRSGEAKGTAPLLAATVPFDLDAISLLGRADIDAAPREVVDGASSIRCSWFGAHPDERAKP